MVNKIKKSAVLKIRQGDLVVFVQNVVTRMRVRPEYAAFLPKVQMLEQQTEAFATALADSASGGADRVAQKEVLKAEMMKTLTSLVDDLNYNHNGLITWGANAGLPVVEERNKPVTEILPPANIRAIPQAVAGELELRYTLPSAKWVRITGLEYSEDDGKTWQNGSYSSKTVMKVKGLPSGKSVLIRLRAIGAGQRSSSWSNALKLFLI